MATHRAARSLDLLLRDITPGDITPHFQPIVDLADGTILGHEVLSRGPSPYASPAVLFTRARQLDLTADLESACRAAALARISSLGNENDRWFLNVTPEVFCDPGANGKVVAAEVRSWGIEPSRIVLEITERNANLDHGLLERAARTFAREGFLIALDDFGAGCSGLLTLISCTPDVIKLDMELTRDVQTSPYKQSVLRSLVSMCAALNALLVAEGVETSGELEMLRRQGVRFAQGRFLADVAPEPRPPGGERRPPVAAAPAPSRHELREEINTP